MPGEASSAPTATYWDAIGRGWLQQPLTLWREFTDRQQLELIRLRNGALLGRLQRLGVVPYQVGATLARRPLLAAVRAAGFEFEVEATRAVMHCPRVLAVWLSRPVHVTWTL